MPVFFLRHFFDSIKEFIDCTVDAIASALRCVVGISLFYGMPVVLEDATTF